LFGISAFAAATIMEYEKPGSHLADVLKIRSPFQNGMAGLIIIEKAKSIFFFLFPSHLIDYQ
jgi:hypothetical protein